MQAAIENYQGGTSGYINSFDTLRALAVFWVLLLHGSFGLFKGGWVGVDLFFVLSGFLITSLLYKEFTRTGSISVLNFYKRRILRLFPALLICVLFANCLWHSSLPYMYGEPNQKIATAAALLYFTNFIDGFTSGNLAHLWSLSVEEHFYLFWPFLSLFIIFRLNKSQAVALITILILLIGVLRIYGFNNQLYIYKTSLKIDSSHFTLCRIDGVLTGSLLFFIAISNRIASWEIKKNTTSIWLFILAIALALIGFCIGENNIYWRNGGFVVTNAICAAAVLIGFKTPNHFFFSSKIAKWIGVRSYGIYLYHFPIFIFFTHFREPHDKLNFFIVSVAQIAATIIISFLSYKYAEQPILKFKKRFHS